MSADVGVLLYRLAQLERERRHYREQLWKVKRSRDKWKAEALEHRRARARGRLYLSTPSTDLSPAERAEASGVV